MNYLEQITKHSLKRPILVFLGVLFLDQTVKYAISKRIIIMDLHENRNALFGIPYNEHYPVILFSIIALYLLLYGKKLISKSSALNLISFSLLAGGIISNLIDRAMNGYILDYLTILGIFSFNLADLAIYSGVFLLLWKIIKK
jgi:signal peptidase II